MHDTFLDVQVAQRGTQLDKDAPDCRLLHSVTFLRLGQDVVTQRVAIKQLHNDVDIA